MYVPSIEHQCQCLESSSTVVEENESCTMNPNKESFQILAQRAFETPLLVPWSWSKLPALFTGSILNIYTIRVRNTATSLEPRLSIPDFVSQLDKTRNRKSGFEARKLQDRIRTESLGSRLWTHISPHPKFSTKPYEWLLAQIWGKSKVCSN